MRQLKHLTQSTPTSCVSACIAMLLGHDSDESIWEDWGRDYFDCKPDHPSFLQYIQSKGIKVDPEYRTIDMRATSPERVYLVVVPSLNILAGSHQIILDLRSYEGNKYLYDPAEGRKDRKYYVINNEAVKDRLQVALSAFAIDCEILDLPKELSC